MVRLRTFRESLCLCYIDELSKKYSKDEYQAKIEAELKRISDATITPTARGILE
jgi:hypothetical protein